LLICGAIAVLFVRTAADNAARDKLRAVARSRV
jgi:hypothetical protein